MTVDWCRYVLEIPEVNLTHFFMKWNSVYFSLGVTGGHSFTWRLIYSFEDERQTIQSGLRHEQNTKLLQRLNPTVSGPEPGKSLCNMDNKYV